MLKTGCLLSLCWCLFVASSGRALASNDAEQVAEDPACTSLQVGDFLGEKQLASLEIQTKNPRKWATNYFKILLDPARNIHPDRKKNHKSILKATFENGVICKFEARIRVHGDWKDHVTGAPALITSLDVKLKNGNIDSVVGFKLLLPHTRNGDNEIFVASLLGEMDFIVPKTYYVPTVFNGVRFTYLFQEKTRKEMLEAQLLREAPILEGDERFIWNDTDKYGVDDRFGLARIANENWTARGETSLQIAAQALDILNQAYLEYLVANRHADSMSKSADPYGIYLNPEILANGNAFALRRNNEYMALMIALRATHALAPHNRKFYYDPMYRYLLPIYYDGDARILDDEATEITRRYLPSETSGAISALKSLGDVNRQQLLQRLDRQRLDIGRARLDRVIARIEASLEQLASADDLPREVKKKAYFSVYDAPDKALAFGGKRALEVVVCDLKLIDCNREDMGLEDYAMLLSGRYRNHQEQDYLYVGGNKQAYQQGEYNPAQAVTREQRAMALDGDAVLTVFGDMHVELDRTKLILTLTQTFAADRAMIAGGTLRDWEIVFRGTERDTLLQRQRFDRNLLTGCLTLLDIVLENVRISADGAQCEDAVNLMRARDKIDSIVINNAKSDALDIDFSDLSIASITIDGAYNDCLDFSGGNYRVEKSDLKNCNDKAISVGEKSTTRFTDVQIRNAEMGVAVKDSSVAEIGSVRFQDVSTCLTATRKKQEFWGSKITLRDDRCPGGVNFQQIGSLIEVRR
jgi:hypothetical protein